MTPESVTHIISQALMTTFWISAPLLLIGFVVGLVINILQIATSLQDSAFSTIPRLAAFLFGFLLLLPWMMNRLIVYASSIFSNLGHYAH
ncbi:MAG: flagellar biosynthetic protein FliQ [Acidobacteria bacterium]|nr:flagellar biosynthetic protein FliQ [Acidobacteriota bacterium]